MSRYQALRLVGCDPLSAGFIALLNCLRGIPPGRVVFLTVELDYTPAGVGGMDGGGSDAKGTHGE